MLRMGGTEESPVAEDFNSSEHTLAPMNVAVIDQIHNHDPCTRKIWESRLDQCPRDFISFMNQP